ncbi:hypothetical protein Tco_0110308 [Tanacetum coccineum]
MKVKESLNVTFDESPPPTKLSPLIDDDVDEEEAIKNYTKVVNNNNEEDESLEVDKVVNIKESKNHPPDQYIKEMLKKFRLEDSKPTKTPMSTEINLTKDDEADFVDSTKYRGDYVGVCTFMGCCLTSWFIRTNGIAFPTTKANTVLQQEGMSTALW